MKEIHAADRHGETVFGAEFAGGSDGVPPVELDVRPVAEADFLFEEADQLARFADSDDACAFELAQ